MNFVWVMKIGRKTYWWNCGNYSRLVGTNRPIIFTNENPHFCTLLSCLRLRILVSLEFDTFSNSWQFIESTFYAYFGLFSSGLFPSYSPSSSFLDLNELNQNIAASIANLRFNSLKFIEKSTCIVRMHRQRDLFGKQHGRN